MSVYVDSLFWTDRSRRWPYDQVCHLVADTLEELHAFAARLGLKRAWFQEHHFLPHYDLTAGKRAQAVALGAADLTRDVVKRVADDWAAARKNAPASAEASSKGDVA